MMTLFRHLAPAACLALLAGPLGGCVAAAALGGAEAGSVAVFGRGIVDIGVSAATGRDCSVVHLDRRQDYCAPRERLPGPEPYCSRTLADVQCWSDPQDFVSVPRQIVDTPHLTTEQERQVTARWPKTLNLED